MAKKLRLKDLRIEDLVPREELEIAFEITEPEESEDSPSHWEGKNLFVSNETPMFIQWTDQQDWGPHDHDFIECVIITHGRTHHRTAHDRRQLQAGDVLIIHPGTWHAYERTRNLFICNFCFSPAILRRELAWVLDHPALSYMFWHGPHAVDHHGSVMVRLPNAEFNEAKKHLKRIEHLLSAPPGHRQAGIFGSMLLFFDMLAEHLEPKYREAIGKTRPIPQEVLTAIHKMEDDPARDWTLEELASAGIGFHPAYFIRLFKTAAGMTPMAYLSQLRAKRAASLLLRSDKPIGQIAAMVGWPDAYYFARRFRKHFNMTASAYRAAFREGEGNR